VVNIRAQSVEWQTPLQIPLRARDLCAVQTARNFDLDALTAKAQRLLDRFAHGAAEGDALLKLRRDLLGLQLRVQFRLLNLLDRNQDFAACGRTDVGSELVNLCAFVPVADAGVRGGDDDL